jgi:hypothetical protein
LELLEWTDGCPKGVHNADTGCKWDKQYSHEMAAAVQTGDGSSSTDITLQQQYSHA